MLPKLNPLKLCLLLSIPLFNSCAKTYYAANAGHTLGLDEKSDVKYSGGFITDSETLSSGLSLKVGYSPVEHIGIQSNFTNIVSHNEEKGYMFNNAVGYYHFFDKEKTNIDNQKWVHRQGHKNGILLEAYGGFAFGSSKNKYLPDNIVHSFLHQYYLQSGVHFYFLRLCKFTLSHRLSLLNFKKISITGPLGGNSNYDLNAIKMHNPFIFNEFNGKFSLGFPKFNFFSILSLGVSNKDFAYSGVSFQLGTAIDFDDIFTRKGKLIKLKR